MKTYIEEIAIAVHQHAHPGETMGESDYQLYLIYAVLVLAKGLGTVPADVHDAWSAWSAAIDNRHRSLVPFNDLSPEVQALDDPYVDAIRTVARELESS